MSPGYISEFGELWRASEKIIFSTTIGPVHAPHTQVEPGFDPDSIRRMKERLEGDISIGGPTLAGEAIAAGLVDEYQLFTVPVIVGGGLRCLPDGIRLYLQLVDERRFGNGTMYASYRPVG